MSSNSCIENNNNDKLFQNVQPPPIILPSNTNNRSALDLEVPLNKDDYYNFNFHNTDAMRRYQRRNSSISTISTNNDSTFHPHLFTLEENPAQPKNSNHDSFNVKEDNLKIKRRSSTKVVAPKTTPCDEQFNDSKPVAIPNVSYMNQNSEQYNNFPKSQPYSQMRKYSMPCHPYMQQYYNQVLVQANVQNQQGVLNGQYTQLIYPGGRRVSVPGPVPMFRVGYSHRSSISHQEAGELLTKARYERLASLQGTTNKEGESNEGNVNEPNSSPFFCESSKELFLRVQELDQIKGVMKPYSTVEDFYYHANLYLKEYIYLLRNGKL